MCSADQLQVVDVNKLQGEGEGQCALSVLLLHSRRENTTGDFGDPSSETPL